MSTLSQYLHLRFLVFPSTDTQCFQAESVLPLAIINDHQKLTKGSGREKGSDGAEGNGGAIAKRREHEGGAIAKRREHEGGAIAKQREHESGAFAVVREGGGGATQRSRWFAKATAASKSVRGGTRWCAKATSTRRAAGTQAQSAAEVKKN